MARRNFRFRFQLRECLMRTCPERWAYRLGECGLYVYYLAEVARWIHETDNGRPLPVGFGEDDRTVLFEHLLASDRLADEPIEYLEFGVHEGASLRYWLEHNKHPDSRFIGFDTFEGLPEDWAAGSRAAGSFSTNGQAPEIDDPRCAFEVGLFQQTLGPFLERSVWNRRLVVMLDADLYSSTLYVLILLARRLQRGDIVIFDEFRDARNEFRAFHDFEKSCSVKLDCVASVRKAMQVAMIVR
jgi:O-methyltransferase